MRYKHIAQFATVIKAHDGHLAHESVLRSFHIVKKLRWLMEQGTSNEVMLELLDLMEQPPEGDSKDE